MLASTAQELRSTGDANADWSAATAAPPPGKLVLIESSY